MRAWREVPAIALTVGELVGYLRVDSTAWRRGLADARAGLDGLAKYSSRELDTLVDTSDRAAAGFVRLALAVSKVATAAWAAEGVGSVVSGLGGAMAVLPALGVAVGVGMVAARVGMSGFGDAMKAVEDPAKFAESLERLSPAARDTAVAVRDLAPAWRSVQQVTQEALFAGVADDVRALGARYLPVLETGLSGVAGEFNNAARGSAAFLGQSRQVETVSGIFGQVRASVGGVTAAVPPLVSILLDLVAVGSEFLPGLSGGFASAAQRAAEFVREARETGQLHEWIASGLATLRQLGELLGNVGGIASAVFSGLDLGGAGLLGTLMQLTGQVRPVWAMLHFHYNRRLRLDDKHIRDMYYTLAAPEGGSGDYGSASGGYDQLGFGTSCTPNDQPGVWGERDEAADQTQCAGTTAS